MSRFLQIWKRPFDGFILGKEGGYRAITQPYILKFGSSVLYLEPKEGNLIQGILKFSFESDEKSWDRATEIFAEKFEYILEILSLENLKLDLKWQSLIPMVPNKGGFKLTATTEVFGHVIVKDIKNIPKVEFLHFKDIFKKIEKNSNSQLLKYALKIANLKTTRDIEQFFYRWVAFNIIYGMIYDGESERKGIENFSSLYPNDNELNQVLADHKNTIVKLKTANLVHFDENYSQLLESAYANNNQRTVWKYALLCIYQIRNNFFHRGIEYPDIKSVNDLLKDILNIAILNIL